MEEIVNTLINSKDKIKFIKDICDMYAGDKEDNTKNKILKMLD